MSQRMVMCAKLGQELPAIDETTSEGRSALKMATILGGAAARQRIHDHISINAWRMWKDHMIMVLNEYRLDATSPEANGVLNEQMEAFLFGPGNAVPGYTPKA